MNKKNQANLIAVFIKQFVEMVSEQLLRKCLGVLSIS